MMPVYPFSAVTQPYPCQQWYIAGWSSEITSSPLRRRLLGQDILLLRTSGGDVQALKALCPHRQMPLCAEHQDGEHLICPYHGAVFETSGQCVSLPFQKHIPKAMDLKSFPVVEQKPFVWIWADLETPADMNRLPDTASLFSHGTEKLLFGTGTCHVEARSQIVLENLFDQSHISFTHPASLGIRSCEDGPAKACSMIEEPTRLCFHHPLKAFPTPDAMTAFFPKLGSTMGIRSRAELFGVSLVVAAGSEIVSCDEEGHVQNSTGQLAFLHGITPETDTTTHYHFAILRDFAMSSEDISEQYASRNREVIAEDVRVLNVIEPCLDQTRACDEPNFVTDAEAIHVRRRIERLILEEEHLRTSSAD
ncbi:MULTISPECIES: aromatic ring-hydroxylating dioxygenase subunit alpha [Gluconobacter]|nr:MULTISPECIES: aromatic ring-hydroxylating dioxygenase subunit alpha [Gluconobacter]